VRAKAVGNMGSDARSSGIWCGAHEPVSPWEPGFGRVAGGAAASMQVAADIDEGVEGVRGFVRGGGNRGASNLLASYSQDRN